MNFLLCLSVELMHRLCKLPKYWLKESPKDLPALNHDHNHGNFVNITKSLKLDHSVPFGIKVSHFNIFEKINLQKLILDNTFGPKKYRKLLHDSFCVNVLLFQIRIP